MATRTNTLLRIENVSMSYGANTILRDVNVRIDDLVRPGETTGQVCGLLGPSGVGKSTLLRIIAGLLKPTAGCVWIGSDHQAVKPGDVGMVTQDYRVYRIRTVLENLIIGARQAKDSPSFDVARSRAVTMINDFGLQGKENLYPSQLSGGQRQRLAIAQQMLACGEMLLFDEPTAGLDPLVKTSVCALISKLANRTEGQTIICCSHDIPSVVAMCDTIWLMGRTPGLSGANVVEEIDLVARGLCWHPDIRHMPEFTETVTELQDRFRTL